MKGIGKLFLDRWPIGLSVEDCSTYRYGFFVMEAGSNEELNQKVAPFFYLFKTDLKVSPAFGLDEFPKLVAGLGEEAKKYGYYKQTSQSELRATAARHHQLTTTCTGGFW